MKKTIIKILSVFACVTIIMSLFSTFSFSVQDCKETGEKYTYIDVYRGEIDHGMLITTMAVKVTGKSSVTSVKIKMELQKLSSGSYSTIETWEQTFSGRTGTLEAEKLTNPLSTYRLKATVTAYAGSASEQKVFYVNES